MNMELPRKWLNHCGWLKAGDPGNDLVISTRIRLARNIDGIPFSQWASSTDLKRIAQQTREAIQQSTLLNEAEWLCMEEMEDIDRHFLCEQYLISRELAKSGIERYVAIHPEQIASIMINEEDHLRLQVLMAGSNLGRTWELIDSIDNEFESHINYAFSNAYGYLTACPTNVGTGIRCSVMVHLPGLVLTRQIEKVLSAVTQVGLTVRGLGGEGSEIAGNLFQISNQWTLGISEIETIEKIEKILNHIVEQERKAQTNLVENKRMKLEDQVWRAYATLRYARVLSSNEAIELLSAIRLGRSTGLLDQPTYEEINEMLIQSRPAHLQKLASQELSAHERDVFRAEMIRKWIETGTNASG